MSAGELFQFFSPEGQLRLAFLVLSAERMNNAHILTWVLIVDRTELAEHFRADVGQTTDWVFDEHDPEWEQLRRVA